MGGASERDPPSPGSSCVWNSWVQMCEPKKYPFCALASLSWVPSFVTKRVLRNVCDKCGGRHASEGTGLGSQGSKALNVHLPGYTSREGHRAEGMKLAAKVHICHRPGSSWEGAPKADGWLCL